MAIWDSNDTYYLAQVVSFDAANATYSVKWNDVVDGETAQQVATVTSLALRPLTGSDKRSLFETKYECERCEEYESSAESEVKVHENSCGLAREQFGNKKGWGLKTKFAIQAKARVGEDCPGVITDMVTLAAKKEKFKTTDAGQALDEAKFGPKTTESSVGSQVAELNLSTASIRLVGKIPPAQNIGMNFNCLATPWPGLPFGPVGDHVFLPTSAVWSTIHSLHMMGGSNPGAVVRARTPAIILWRVACVSFQSIADSSNCYCVQKMAP
jgi:hypothetical protein